MDPDLMLVIGLVLAVLTIPSMLSAYAESRPPRAAAIVSLIAGVLIAVALTNKAGGYSIAEIPDVFYRVIGRYLN
ncbi:hypothetical protein [Szabonella alba]|uniref:50S ribosomal protein L35 n=1 Tax=Szabonella alba TaxID=2804194 RepID=A0A8K0VC86_9RHOB|nr:hypothetical protein [Szabonella alba]MBL4918351.1 hypothetical protein [Szabonella alba]